MKILFFGDIVGRLGLEAVASLLPKLAKEYDADFIIANGENVSKGRGITESDYEQLLDAGVDVVTLGNHWNDKKQIANYIDNADCLIRPLNLVDFDHGVGSAVFDLDGIPVRVTNILGQAFMKEEVKSPYQAMNELFLEEEPTAIHNVDFHAESTSEKQVFAHWADGKVSAVLGTHTHVQTNDPHILPNGTGYLSDAGMCGAYDSIIGFTPESVLRKIVDGETDGHFEIADKAETVVSFIYMEIDEFSGKCVRIAPISYIGGKCSHGENHL